MRVPAVLPFLSIALLLSCRAVPSVDPEPAEAAPRSELLAQAALALGGPDSPRAEAFLAAAGGEAVPVLETVRRSGTDAARWKATGLLLSAGVDITLPPGDVVELSLFELCDEEPWPHSSLLALERVRALGPAAVPHLRAAGEGTGPRAETARRLLAMLPEVP